MQTPCFLEKLTLKNILSFGPKGETIELQPLNVLIGPNGSGKSNLIEVIRLIKALPKDLAEPIRQGGGIQEWLWKGVSGSPTGAIEIIANAPKVHRYEKKRISWEHLLLIEKAEFRANITKEIIDVADLSGSLGVFSAGEKVRFTSDKRKQKIYKYSDLGQSFLAALVGFKSEVDSNRLSILINLYSKIAIFHEGVIHQLAILRSPTPADLPSDFLLDDGINLPLVWNQLRNMIPIKSQLLEEMRRFNPQIEDITISVQANTVLLFFHEEGLHHPIPATRVSAGTLRYLCLLTILLHPSPPPLICLEEPELGLHPDIVQRIAELLVEASERTQLIVTTHSETLVSRIGDYSPEAVMVCERDEDGTHVNRLNPDQLKEWLEKYSLGHLWATGEIGGNP
jgi:predicted ATPase